MSNNVCFWIPRNRMIWLSFHREFSRKRHVETEYLQLDRTCYWCSSKKRGLFFNLREVHISVFTKHSHLQLGASCLFKSHGCFWLEGNMGQLTFLSFLGCWSLSPILFATHWDHWDHLSLSLFDMNEHGVLVTEAGIYDRRTALAYHPPLQPILYKSDHSKEALTWIHKVNNLRQKYLRKCVNHVHLLAAGIHVRSLIHSARDNLDLCY